MGGSGGLLLTDHRGLDKAPCVGLWNVRLEDPRSSARLVYAPEHVDLAAAHRGCRRVHGLGQRGHGLPLVGNGVVPGERGKREPSISGGPCAGQRAWGEGRASICFLPLASLAQPGTTHIWGNLG